jgi:hypothetical protein
MGGKKVNIQQSATAREVKYLFHFTRVDNLPSILQHGLLPLDLLAARGMATARNDVQRIDGTSGVCLTIGFPNYKMFYPLRMDNPDVKWAVLAIRAAVLWEMDCAFCRENAAKSEVTAIPLHLRKGLGAFNAMFDDYPGKPRSMLNIPTRFPTHPQAEVLVFDPIPPQYIVAIIFDDAELKRRYTALNVGPKVEHMPPYFAGRQDFEHWR